MGKVKVITIRFAETLGFKGEMVLKDSNRGKT
jgi:hypothetical protein